MAILEYLEEAYPHKNLLPKNIEKRFKVREICEIIVSGKIVCYCYRYLTNNNTVYLYKFVSGIQHQAFIAKSVRFETFPRRRTKTMGKEMD